LAQAALSAFQAFAFHVLGSADMAFMTGSLTVPSVDMLSEAATTAGSGSSSRSSSPRLPVDAVRCHQVIVKSTFIELADSPSKSERRRRFGRCKTDSLCAMKAEFEVYEPGRFSDDVQKQQAVDASQSLPEVVPLQLMNSIVFIALMPQPTQCAPVEQTLAPVKPEPRQRERKAKTARTTLMMRNLPNNYTRDMLLEMLDAGGFSGLYDFVYLPCDFGRNANLGYAFVNLVAEDHTEAFWDTFDGFSQWSLPTAKVCEISWGGPHQGFKAHVDRYKNSPVMHESVPDEYKPVIFANGVRKPFPSPNRKIKSPKA